MISNFFTFMCEVLFHMISNFFITFILNSITREMPFIIMMAIHFSCQP